MLWRGWEAGNHGGAFEDKVKITRGMDISYHIQACFMTCMCMHMHQHTYFNVCMEVRGQLWFYPCTLGSNNQAWASA